MRILILGGTRFLGRHIVEQSLVRGHELTLFHRGESGMDLFDGRVQRILGNRETDLSLLESQEWDAVIDTCGFVPRIVDSSARKIAESTIAMTYLFVSSISVLEKPHPGADETWPVGTLKVPDTEEITGESYGPLKALCEDTVRNAFPKTHLIVRPGLIVGPYDTTDRFTYWPWRISRGGDILVPGRKDQPVQFIDVRDLAEWCVSALEDATTGTYNLTGPREPYPLGQVLDDMRRQLCPDARFVWVDPSKLEDWNMQPWSELPLYLGAGTESDGMMAVSIKRALSKGLKFRPLAETVRDTLDFANARELGHEWKAGLKPDRERELLDVWWS